MARNALLTQWQVSRSQTHTHGLSSSTSTSSSSSSSSQSQSQSSLLASYLSSPASLTDDVNERQTQTHTHARNTDAEEREEREEREAMMTHQPSLKHNRQHSTSPTPISTPTHSQQHSSSSSSPPPLFLRDDFSARNTLRHPSILLTTSPSTPTSHSAQTQTQTQTTLKEANVKEVEVEVEGTLNNFQREVLERSGGRDRGREGEGDRGEVVLVDVYANCECIVQCLCVNQLLDVTVNCQFYYCY